VAAPASGPRALGTNRCGITHNSEFRIQHSEFFPGRILFLTKPSIVCILDSMSAAWERKVPRMPSMKASNPRPSWRFRFTLIRQEVRHEGASASRDVKNADRSGDVYENKGRSDKMPEEKSDICGNRYGNGKIIVGHLRRGDGSGTLYNSPTRTILHDHSHH
jgi:hypothetical protein